MTASQGTVWHSSKLLSKLQAPLCRCLRAGNENSGCHLLQQPTPAAGLRTTENGLAVARRPITNEEVCDEP
jgi:hypothetical protein